MCNRRKKPGLASDLGFLRFGPGLGVGQLVAHPVRRGRCEQQGAAFAEQLLASKKSTGRSLSSGFITTPGTPKSRAGP